MGSARKLNLWPTAGWKSFFISHSSISALCVRARQTFSGGCGISRSTTTERVAAAGLVIGPSCSTECRDDRTGRPHPVDEGLQASRLGAAAGLASLAPFAHQAGVLEDA